MPVKKTEKKEKEKAPDLLMIDQNAKKLTAKIMKISRMG